MTEFLWRCPKCKQILSTKFKKDLGSLRAKHYAGHRRIAKVIVEHKPTVAIFKQTEVL